MIGDVVYVGALGIGLLAGGFDGAGQRGALQRLWGRFGLGEREQEKFFRDQQADMECDTRRGAHSDLDRRRAAIHLRPIFRLPSGREMQLQNQREISLPGQINDPSGTLLCCQGLWEVPPEQLFRLLPSEKTLGSLQKRL